MKGLETGIEQIDRGLRGLKDGKLYCICSPAEEERTNLIAQTVMGLATRDNSVLLFSLEKDRRTMFQMLFDIYWQDIVRRIFVLVLLKAFTLRQECLVFLLEAVGDILQEYQPKHHRLVFRCVQVATQQVGCLPNLFLKTDIGCIDICHSDKMLSVSDSVYCYKGTNI